MWEFRVKTQWCLYSCSKKKHRCYKNIQSKNYLNIHTRTHKCLGLNIQFFFLPLAHVMRVWTVTVRKKASVRSHTWFQLAPPPRFLSLPPPGSLCPDSRVCITSAQVWGGILSRCPKFPVPGSSQVTRHAVERDSGSLMAALSWIFQS